MITKNGREKVIAAKNAGLFLNLIEIAVGDGTSTPNENTTALTHERARFPIADGTRMGERLHITAVMDGEEMEIFEIGVFGLLEGEKFLFAIEGGSSPLGVKRANNSLLLAFDLTLVGFAETIIVKAEGPRLNLTLAEEFASLTNSFLTHHTLIKQMQEELATLKARVSALEES